MNNEIEKSDQPSPDDVLAAVQSFNDPNIITNMFRELGWTYSVEIKETLTLAKQNANLSIKFKAIKHLRELLREAAEASGYVANVSTTAPNAHGGHTTFSAKRISGILNPVKKIESTEIKESQNDKKRLQSVESPPGCDEGKPDRGSDRGQSKTAPEGYITRSEYIRKLYEDEKPVNEQSRPPDSSSSGTDTRRAFPLGDVDSGGTEPPDGGETSGRAGDTPGKDDKRCIGRDDSNPCVKTRPPTCDQDLFPGISSAGD